MLLTASFVVNTLAGAAFVLAGITILAMNPPRRGVPWFAAYAVVTGLQQAIGNVGAALQDPVVAAIAYPFLAVTPITIVLAATRYAGLPSDRWVWPFAASSGLGLVLLYFSRDLVIVDATGLLATWGFVLWQLPVFIAIGFAVLVLTRHLATLNSPELRIETSLLLLATLPYLAYSNAFFLNYFTYYTVIGPYSIISPLADRFQLLVALVCLTIVVVSLPRIYRSGTAGRRLGSLTVTVGVVGLLQPFLSPELALFGGVLRILAALALGYGLLKFGIFGIEAKLKSGIRRGALVAVFGGVFLIVEQAAQFVVSETFGVFAGLAAAVLLAFGLVPLRAWSRKVADRAMPEVADTPEYLASRRVSVYRAAYESAARDGVLTARERGILETLRSQLGVTREEAGAVEAATRSPTAGLPAGA